MERCYTEPAEGDGRQLHYRILQKHVASSPSTVAAGQSIQWPGSGNAMVSNAHTSNDKRS